METQNQYPQRDYSEIISLAHQVIDLPVRKAQMLLKNLDLCMITYTWNDVSQITLEVVFKPPRSLAFLIKTIFVKLYIYS